MTNAELTNVLRERVAWMRRVGEMSTRMSVIDGDGGLIVTPDNCGEWVLYATHNRRECRELASEMLASVTA